MTNSATCCHEASGRCRPTSSRATVGDAVLRRSRCVRPVPCGRSAHGPTRPRSVSLVNENVTPYCYVKMSSPVREAFCGGHEVGWIGSTGGHARDDEVWCGGGGTAGAKPALGGASGGGGGGARRPCLEAAWPGENGLPQFL